MRHPATVEHQRLLTETIANHFPSAKIDGDTVELGVGGLRIACEVNGFNTLGGFYAAHLYFNLWGGRLGEAPIFASVSGYSEKMEAAVITGACNWACSFGPVLRAALGDEDVPDVDRFDVTLDGRVWRVFLDGLDRALMFGGAEGAPTERLGAARARLGATPWVLRRVLESGTLPLLATDSATVVGAFVSDSHESRTVEVKIHGQDWPASTGIFQGAPPEPDGAITMLRELAVMVPQGPPAPLNRAAIQRTLDGVTQALPSSSRPMAQWPGWSTHRGQLDEPMKEDTVRALESELGPLPAPYRAFLTQVAESGAGPGYGLLSPSSPAQLDLARGAFKWRDGEEPAGRPQGCIAIAYAGCGVMWLLVLNGPHRGEVWADAVGSDRVARRVSSSFDGFYRAWLDALLRNAHTFTQWNAQCCATPNVLTQLLESLEKEGLAGDAAVKELGKRLKPGSISLMSGGTAYFDEREHMNPCLPCVMLVERLGLSADVFAPGDLPRHARPRVREEGLLARWARKLGRREG